MDEAQIYSRLAEIFEDVFDDDTIQLMPSCRPRMSIAGIASRIFAFAHHREGIQGEIFDFRDSKA